jgi:hypothetical protein
MRSSIFPYVALAFSLPWIGCGGGHRPDVSGSLGSALSSGTLTVRDTSNASFAAGTATHALPSGEQPDVCTALGVTCVQFDLEIEIPLHAWRSPGGVQIAIRWPNFDNALNLYVYRQDVQTGADVQVGSSTGILGGSAGSLLLRCAANGTYRVYVALDPANSVDSSVPFDVEARVQYDPPVHPVRPLLPDYSMRPQTTVTFDTPSFSFFGDADPPAGESCYQSEKDEDGAEVCLRFNQTFANVGEGPAELHFAVPKDLNDASHNVFARTYFSDGPDHFVDSPAGEWEFHAAHQHYHYQSFAQSNLWVADAEGRRVGTVPIRGGRKVSFCLEDEALDALRWGKEGVGPRFYRAPDCLVLVAEDTLYNYLIQGLTPGWDDIYDWFLPGQYIDVAGLESGDYVLETIVDPDNKLVESDETNNCGTVLVRMTEMGTPQRHAEIVGPGPGCTSAGR